MNYESLKKPFILIGLILIILSGLYYWTEKKQEMFKILQSMENKIYNPSLWQASVVDLKHMGKEKQLFENRVCKKAEVTVNLQLKDTCWIKKEDEVTGFLKKNALMEKIINVFSQEVIDKPIYSLNNCLTEQMMLDTIKQIEEEEKLLVGKEECVSYDNIIFGGACSKTKIKTQEEVDLFIKDLKLKVKAEIKSYPIIQKGTEKQFKQNIEICEDESGEETVNLDTEE